MYGKCTEGGEFAVRDDAGGDDDGEAGGETLECATDGRPLVAVKLFLGSELDPKRNWISIHDYRPAFHCELAFIGNYGCWAVGGTGLG